MIRCRCHRSRAWRWARRRRAILGSRRTVACLIGASALIAGATCSGALGSVPRRQAVSTASASFIADPFLQEGAKLVGYGASEEFLGGGEFGRSVAVSGDGGTALVGGPRNARTCPFSYCGSGSVWVFTRSGSGWETATTLTPPADAIGGCCHFGAAVAVSTDGRTALIGAPVENTLVGAAWVMSRSGGTWSEQQKLTGGGAWAEQFFAHSVGLSGDGNTALIAGPAGAWVFTRSGSSWTQQGPTLLGNGEQEVAAVALSRDGNTAVLGSPLDDGAWVFTRSGSTWAQQGEKLSGTGQLNGEYGVAFGCCVALSSDGNTALIGAPYDNAGQGAVWTFVRSGSTWKQQGAKFTGTGQAGEAGFGSSIAISDGGDVALIGGPVDSGNAGLAWVFTRSGAIWSELERLRPSDESGEGHFGWSVALSGDGNTALAGGWGDNGAIGTAWLFGHPAPVVATGRASAVTQRAATLEGSVNPNEALGECRLEYGTTTAYGLSVACSPWPGSVRSPVSVSASLAGLAPHTGYHFRLSAANGAGTAYGADQTFQTTPDPPVVVTGAASAVGPAYATLNATVNPNGGRLSVCRFEYGTSPSYGSSALCSAGGQAGEDPVAVSIAVGVRARTTYHFRISAGNSGGTSVGGDQIFQTTAAPPPRVQASMTWNFAWSRRYTVVRSLTVHGVPNGGRVEVSCTGPGCPFAHSHSATIAPRSRCARGRCQTRSRQGPTVSLGPLFKSRYLGVGTRITVSIVKRGWVGKTFLFTVRSDRAPAFRVACLAAGSNRPGHGC
jgi:hypothetical protein